MMLTRGDSVGTGSPSGIAFAAVNVLVSMNVSVSMNGMVLLYRSRDATCLY